MAARATDVGEAQSLPDVVYLLGPNEGEELRYSLRSLANLPHGRVWLVGTPPRWVRNVERLPVGRRGDKWQSQAANLRAYCEHDDGTETFVLFNDDFFVMRPIRRVPVWHRGLLADVAKRHNGRPGTWPRLLRQTSKRLGPDALAYDSIHTPMLVEKRKMLAVLNEYSGLLFRSAYGNHWQIGGTEHEDVKIRSGKPRQWSLLSTSNTSFRKREVGEVIRNRFPERSPHE